MGAGLELTSYYATDLLGALLMVMLLLGKGWKIPTKRRESKIFLDMITATLAGCVLDAIGWTVDGQPGMFNRVIVYACNTMLFSLNVVIGPGCITVVSEHIKEKPPAWHRKGIAVLCIAELSLLAVNFFVPLVFPWMRTTCITAWPFSGSIWRWSLS